MLIIHSRDEGFKRMRILIFSVFSLLLIQASHAEWIKVSQNSSETYFLDDDSVNLDFKRDIGKIWVKSQIAVKKPTNSTVTQKRSYFEISCKDRTLKVLASTSYDRNQKVINTFESVSPKSINIIPETVGDDFYQIVCTRLMSAVKEDPRRLLLDSLSSVDSCFKREAAIQKQLIFNEEKLKSKIKLECKNEIKDAALNAYKVAEYSKNSELSVKEEDILFETTTQLFEERIEEAIK